MGPKTERKLAALGVGTIGDLARIPRSTLQERFGPSLGAYLARAARGSDERPLRTARERKSIGHETTFQVDVTAPEELGKALAELCERVASRARARGLRGRNLTVKLRFADFDTQRRATVLSAASDEPDALRRAALACLERFELDRPVRLLGVRLGFLERAQS